jgi:hypothetical protein
VLPVTDLTSSLNSKRVIQLHKFGQTKTGSITVEVFYAHNFKILTNDYIILNNNFQNYKK